MNEADLPPDLGFAVRTARAAGAITMRWFQTPGLVADGKHDGSPVTEADRAAERFVREAVARAFPGDGVIGEEFPPAESTTGRTWIVDPIDGTRSFVQGVPLFGTMLGLMVNGEPTVGAICMPALDECVGAQTGHGCWWWKKTDTAPARARVSRRDDLHGAVCLSTSLEYYSEPRHKRAWSRLNDLGAITRGWSDCYAFVLLATGRADAVIEPGVKLWDVAAVPPIITEAGGVWTDIDGDHNLHAGSIVATNARLHAAVIDAIRTA
jgi:histidinol phosphatase-like enzyme (inositol monophosphatase family)